MSPRRGATAATQAPRLRDLADQAPLRAAAPAVAEVAAMASTLSTRRLTSHTGFCSFPHGNRARQDTVEGGFQWRRARISQPHPRARYSVKAPWYRDRRADSSLNWKYSTMDGDYCAMVRGMEPSSRGRGSGGTMLTCASESCTSPRSTRAANLRHSSWSASSISSSVTVRVCWPCT